MKLQIVAAAAVLASCLFASEARGGEDGSPDLDRDQVRRKKPEVAAVRPPVRGPAPANDDCAAATPVGPGTFGVDTAAATLDGASACDFAFGLPPGPDVWFEYTATATGTTRFTSIAIDPSPFDSIISVHSACPGTAANEIVCADLFADDSTSISVSAGEKVWVRIAGFNEAAGTADLTIAELGAPPVNDDCADAIPVGLGTFPATLDAATADGTSSCTDPSDLSDLWYRYTVPADGVYVFTNTLPGGGISVHTGCPGGLANELDCGFQSNPRLSAGQEIFIRVRGVFGGGDWTLSEALPTPNLAGSFPSRSGAPNAFVTGLENDGSGNLLFTDIGTDEVGIMNTSGQQLSSFLAEQPASLLGVTTDGLGIFATDTTAAAVETYTPTGTFLNSFDVSGETSFPEGITFSPRSGSLFVVDGDANSTDSILEYTTAGTLLNQTSLATVSTDGIAYDPQRCSFWVYDSGSDTVTQYAESDLSVLGSFAGTFNAGFSNGEGVAVIGDTVYVQAFSDRTTVGFDVSGFAAAPGCMQLGIPAQDTAGLALFVGLLTLAGLYLLRRG